MSTLATPGTAENPPSIDRADPFQGHDDDLPGIALPPLDLTGLYRGDISDAVAVVLGAIELRTLAEHHEQMAGDFRRSFGEDETADLMEARAAELRSAADRGAAHWATLSAGAAR